MPDGDRLLAERGGVGAEPAGALQGDRLGVEGARQHHGPVEPDELPASRAQPGMSPSIEPSARRMRVQAMAKLATWLLLMATPDVWPSPRGW